MKHAIYVDIYMPGKEKSPNLSIIAASVGRAGRENKEAEREDHHS